VSEVEHRIHSPLTLLREWQDGGEPLVELLVTGYTHDLVFLERHCLAPARAMGARATVLGDAGYAVHEPVDVRHAGRSYQYGLASCGGAFHPKLVVLVGEERVWVAIGSGNPTMSGWGHNEELWLVVRSSGGRGPAALGDLASWLEDLPSVVAMPTWIADTITTIGQKVAPTEIDTSLAHLQIFGNLRRSVLSQLPSGPVTTLRLSAPFLDARSRAVHELVARFAPAEVQIALQPTLSQYDGATLVAATSSAQAVRFTYLGEKRTSHGKLVEWTTGRETLALTGSANLSAAAMLATTAAGGNCELVTLFPVSTSKLPDGDVAPTEEIRSANTIPSRREEVLKATVTLLGARRLPDHVAVELVAGQTGVVTIETSVTASPGTWQPAHREQAERSTVTTFRFLVSEQLGGALRATMTVDGDTAVSAVVFLTDTVRCLPRRLDDDRPRLAVSYVAEDLFTDAALAQRFAADLARLISQVLEHRSVSVVPLRSVTPGHVSATSDDKWGTWVSAIERTLGATLTNLVFPGALLPVSALVTGWSVGPEADENELADGEDETDIDPLAEENSREIPRDQRAFWRAAAKRLSRQISGHHRPWIELRMCVATLYLNLLAGGVWKSSDDSWFDQFATVVTALAVTEDEEAAAPGRTMSFHSSLIAVCFAVLFRDASPYGGRERDIILKAAWEKAGSYAAFAEPGLVVDYLRQAQERQAVVVGEEEVQRVIDAALEMADDPHSARRSALREAGLDVVLFGNVWVSHGDFRNPRRIAARIATIAEAPCAVVARNGRTCTALVWAGGELAVVESTTRRWRIYRMSPMATPLSLLGGDEGLPQTRDQRPLRPAPATVLSHPDLTDQDIVQLIATVELGASST
jgi:hypothetical protein